MARDRAADLAALYRSGVHDLHAHFEREREAADQAEQAARDARAREAAEAERGTLDQLLPTYADHLKSPSLLTSRFLPHRT